MFMVLLLTGCSKELESSKVSCKQKDDLVSNGAVIIDVRSKEEYEDYHLEGAINIPYTEIATKIKEYSNITKDTKIVVYCKSGVRSGKAFETLKSEGYLKVYDLGSINSCL